MHIAQLILRFRYEEEISRLKRELDHRSYLGNGSNPPTGGTLDTSQQSNLPNFILTGISANANSSSTPLNIPHVQNPSHLNGVSLPQIDFINEKRLRQDEAAASLNSLNSKLFIYVMCLPV